VFLVGGIGIDNIKRLKLLNRSELEASLEFELGPKNLLITFHPVTLEAATATGQMKHLLSVLADLEDTKLIFTFPNADTDGRALIQMIEQFVDQHANARAYPSLGQLRYLSCVAHVDGVIGNSSSGLSEIPSFHKGTVNIGDRQRGRLQAASVIQCEPTRKEIASAIERLYSNEFQSTLSQASNPYGSGGASDKVITTIKSYPLESLVKKQFYDLPIQEKPQ
jgi:GDP/UDP-N,N'-diacetylbacillosamine 2-epimerase (hydrolysing)